MRMGGEEPRCRRARATVRRGKRLQGGQMTFHAKLYGAACWKSGPQNPPRSRERNIKRDLSTRLGLLLTVEKAARFRSGEPRRRQERNTDETVRKPQDQGTAFEYRGGPGFLDLTPDSAKVTEDLCVESV